MKNLKKVLACVMAVATLGSVSAIGVSAQTLSDNYRYDYSVNIDASEFGTILSDKNLMDLVTNDFYEDSTVLHFKDGTTYTIPCACRELIALYISDSEEKLVGYTVSAFGYNAYDEYVKHSERSKPESVTLPDGKVLYPYKIHDCYNIELIYNLDGKYIGYRITSSMEGPKSGIYYKNYDSNTIGESENKPITEFTVGDSTFPRGDINLDGKVNTVDLLMLKKYLLGLMEW